MALISVNRGNSFLVGMAIPATTQNTFRSLYLEKGATANSKPVSLYTNVITIQRSSNGIIYCQRSTSPILSSDVHASYNASGLDFKQQGNSLIVDFPNTNYWVIPFAEQEEIIKIPGYGSYNLNCSCNSSSGGLSGAFYCSAKFIPSPNPPLLGFIGCYNTPNCGACFGSDFRKVGSVIVNSFKGGFLLVNAAQVISAPSIFVTPTNTTNSLSFNKNKISQNNAFT